MKTKLLLSMLLLVAAAKVNAQTIVKGDMNDDGVIDIVDVTSTVDVAVGKKAKESINLSVNPYKVDNSTVVGTWYAPDGPSFQFNEDGTTTFPGGATYEFMPMQGRLLIFDAMKHPVKVLPLLKVENEYLLTVDYATSVFVYYTNSESLATDITLDQTSLTLNSGTTAQLTATISPETAFASVSWTSSDNSVATVDINGVVTANAGGTCIISAKTNGGQKTATCTITVLQMVANIKLSETMVALELDAFVRLSATVLPANASNKNVTWSSSNEDVASVRNGRVDAYGYGTAIITCEAADGSGVQAVCKVFVDNPESYVDLDLPSHTLWATCNVGAINPEDYGGYFAWGETVPYGKDDITNVQNYTSTGSYTKTSFSWETYKWCNGFEKTLIKYCDTGSCGYNGFTDELKELELVDDAAYMNWGPGWRMPSMEQLYELFNNKYTTLEWVTLNGVNGCKITSNSNGNSIFLPAAGYRNSWLSFDTGVCGCYWSRKTGEAWHDCAYKGFKSNFDYSYHYGRYHGHSVRPVRTSE